MRLGMLLGNAADVCARGIELVFVLRLQLVDRYQNVEPEAPVLRVLRGHLSEKLWPAHVLPNVSPCPVRLPAFDVEFLDFVEVVINRVKLLLSDLYLQAQAAERLLRGHDDLFYGDSSAPLELGIGQRFEFSTSRLSGLVRACAARRHGDQCKEAQIGKKRGNK